MTNAIAWTLLAAFPPAALPPQAGAVGAQSQGPLPATGPGAPLEERVRLRDRTVGAGLAGLYTSSATDHSGGIAWIDYNNDYWADLFITKTDGNISDVAGTTVTYTIEVGNAGPSMITDAPVADVMPAELSGATWSCSTTAGSACGGISGSGDIATTLDLLAGGTATFTVTATIDSAFTGTLSNTASVSMPGPGVDPTPGNNIAVDTTDVVAVADLSVTKTDGVVSEVPGTAVSYTIVVSNAGPSDVVGASVTDVLPVSVSNVSWSCVGAAGGVCSLSGSGDVVDVIDVASGGSVTYTVSGDLAADASGVLVNAVSVAVPGSVTDPDLSNNSATDVDTLVPTADLSVTKTDGVVSEVPGTAVSYTIVVSNAGPSDIVGASVTDVFPGTLIGASWSCVAVNGACPASGSGSINALVDLATGGAATFTVDATVSSSAPLRPRTWTARSNSSMAAAVSCSDRARTGLSLPADRARCSRYSRFTG